MGQLLSFISSLFSGSTVRMLILGLDSAGKTTILYRFASGETIKTVPTIGFNLEELKHQDLTFKVWDLGGQEALRPYWRCYYQNTNAIIFVVDSCDVERMGIVAKELQFLCAEKELQKSVFAIFANKQDDPSALKPDEISDALKLHELKNNTWAIFATSGVTGQGLEEGLTWIAQQCK
ncbi:ADP-ribosylation factor [Entamoeba marina]